MKISQTGYTIWKLCFMDFPKVKMVERRLLNSCVDISIETLSNLFEIYTHLLTLPDISAHVLCILLDSISSLLDLKLADSDFEHITPLLSDFLECLFSVQCKQYHHYDEESALASALTFYNSLSASPCWSHLSNDLIWSVLYSLYSIYSQVICSCSALTLGKILGNAAKRSQ